jgi:hypothetical protein
MWTGRVMRADDRIAVEAAEREWWAPTSAGERIHMVDEISANAYAMSGIDLREQRLQRSSARILRRRR